MSENSTLHEELDAAINAAVERGRELALKDLLSVKIKQLKPADGDVLVLIGTDLPQRGLQYILSSLRGTGFKSVIQIDEEADVAKLSDINLKLLGLEKIK